MDIPLRLFWDESAPRTAEPVTWGLPFPRGTITDPLALQLLDPANTPLPLQTEILSRWSDGSIRWLLCDAQITANQPGESGHRFVLQPGLPLNARPAHPSPIFVDTSAAANPERVTVVTAGQRWEFRVGDEFVHPLLLAQLREVGPNSLDQPIEITAVKVLSQGPLRTRLRIEAFVPMEPVLKFHADVECFAGVPAWRIRVVMTNRAVADHPDGNWDLGNGGSFLIEQLNLRLTAPPGELTGSLERHQPLQPWPAAASVYQDSSGRPQWQHANHVDARRVIPVSFSGYQWATPEATLGTGLQATPILARGGVAFSLPYFWELFPKALSATTEHLVLEWFPRRGNHRHELQGGEQTSLGFVAHFAPDQISRFTGGWGRSPMRVCARPAWYCHSGVIPDLTPAADDPHPAYHPAYEDYLAQARTGETSFIAKRDRIDEYGWRHFGDFYGDHEAVYHTGPQAMVSHYNNQYDCILACLQQWFRDGESAWWFLAFECAQHTADIDRYHTDEDKAAYNGGLFWHTYHYAPADTGTHRSYPRSLRTGDHFSAGQDLATMGKTGADLKKIYAVGGGPAGSHNYNAGLALAYYLTGDPHFRDAAIGLADFVVQMDDPRGTILKWLSLQPTGLATESGYRYHGPGRAPANSILALLTGHELTQEERYLRKCEELIRRVVHPQQDLEALDLLNAELRWYYTMTLQALGVYLDYQAERQQYGWMYAYTQETLLHYARWMADHEHPILDRAEQLQYPTETWAAQDLRKVEVFQFAAAHATGAERERFLERARWFYTTSLNRLLSFPTRDLCRPRILAMRYGWSHAAWREGSGRVAPPPAPRVPREAFGTPSRFIPQKEEALRRAKWLLFLGGLIVVGLFILGLVWLLPWLA